MISKMMPERGEASILVLNQNKFSLLGNSISDFESAESEDSDLDISQSI